MIKRIKKTVKSKLLITINTVLFVNISLMGYAQKLSKYQEISIRAPSGIIIDGKSSEWENDKLQAYDPANHLAYTVSNDDDNLYLIMRASGKPEINKIMKGGIALTVSHLLGKSRTNDTNTIALRFPIIGFVRWVDITQSYKRYDDFKMDTMAYRKQIDSLTRSINKISLNAFKEIEIHGIKEIDSPSISIYNTYGIKTMALFDNKMFFTYEIAIPLKYLGISVNGSSKFSYNIKLPGPPPSKPGKIAAPLLGSKDESVDFDAQYQNYPTDIWNEYTLSKK